MSPRVLQRTLRFQGCEFAEALRMRLRRASGEDPYLDISRLTEDTGFKPRFDIAASVADYVEWRKDNPR
ncbi:hypothetical protein AB0F52_29365 [Amycolatopsis sp. NPDC024027]|uniref:hypothetical protein n=1 Tax=Amycolatopsis sp. NPDC024027 TaxID=3154327 RepID=UPI003406819F